MLITSDGNRRTIYYGSYIPGPIREIYSVNDQDQLHGEYKHWYVSGQLYEHIYYLNGKKHGEYKTYHSNGQIEEHVQYHIGLRTGEYLRYHANGKLKIRAYYTDDIRNGKYEAWHSNGNPWTHCYYGNQDELHGEYKSWYMNGNLKCHEYHRDGIRYGSYKQYGENSKLPTYVAYRSDDGRLQGVSKGWSWNLDFPDYLRDMGVSLTKEGLVTYNYWYDNQSIAKLTLEIVMSLLYFKHRLRLSIKCKIRGQYLDNYIIPDLGNIVLLFYFKE
jgi:antitoxin component YwqK of YwqJK toxin-antitoxin module